MDRASALEIELESQRWITLLEKGLDADKTLRVSPSDRCDSMLAAIILTALNHNLPIVVNDYRDIEKVSDFSMQMLHDESVWNLSSRKGKPQTPCILTTKCFNKCKGVNLDRGVLIDIKGSKAFSDFLRKAIANNIIVRSGFYRADDNKGE